MPEIKITLEPGAVAPEYQSRGAAGADICAFLKEDLVISPGETVLVPTGVRMEIPGGHEIQVRPRSGLAVNPG
jgi:dUTP pyrophosphatase